MDDSLSDSVSPHIPSRNWILLRGLARGVGHWGSFIGAMRKRFPHAEIELLDLPGNGEYIDVTSPLSISQYVDFVREKSLLLQKKEPVNILALSLGAMVTVDWMRRYPAEIHKAFLVGTSSSSNSRFYERFRLINLIKGAPLLTAKNESVWEETILGMVANNDQRRREELPLLLEYTRTHKMKPSNVLRQLLAASRYRFPKAAPGNVQLIGSYGDRLVSPRCTLRIAEAWKLQPLMHPSAGHDIAVDDPQWLLKQLT